MSFGDEDLAAMERAAECETALRDASAAPTATPPTRPAGTPEALSAGREMDALVAEAIGWTLADRVKCGWGDGPPVWITGEDPDDENASPTFQNFQPSTNIAHAWRALEAAPRRFDGKRWRLVGDTYQSSPQWQAFIRALPNHLHHLKAADAALGISRAIVIGSRALAAPTEAGR